MRARPFETSVGRFWGIVDTRDYMRARYTVLEAVLLLKTRDAVQAALDYCLDLLRQCRSDNMGVRDFVPSLYLRLNREQECYDFLKWYATTGQEGDYDWGDMELGFLDVKNADVLESPDLWTKAEWINLSEVFSITMLKIRILLDLRRLQSASIAMSQKVPQELGDEIRGRTVGPHLSQRKEVMNSKDFSPFIKTLEEQVKAAYRAVKAGNKHFWPAILEPKDNLSARPYYSSSGTREEMQICLKQSYDAWTESPGAIEIIRKLVTTGEC